MNLLERKSAVEAKKTLEKAQKQLVSIEERVEIASTPTERKLLSQQASECTLLLHEVAEWLRAMKDAKS